ncbi:hypothetical protein Acr_11g0012300 [Actinidia rufa]|uniref:Uncharacterized protein n=1 Tax=Actinidia rufa TaxID=165716 RepID=A0A7J0FDZ2_9ERIC|nr:hypothetical protein Acr_11g0012300 [Actinidia rufa]
MVAIEGGNVDNGVDRRGKKQMVMIASGGDAQELVVVGGDGLTWRASMAPCTKRGLEAQHQITMMAWWPVKEVSGLVLVHSVGIIGDDEDSNGYGR